MRTQERAITTFNTRLEELGQDMEASFKQVVAYHVHSEQVIETRFNEVEARLDKVDARLDNIEATMVTKEDLAKVETRLNENMVSLETRLNENMVSLETRLNENMAKVETHLQENINAMGARVFDGFKQMITMIDLRLPPPSHGE
jgi:tetrahydromethanopterin S-methyltransferase subunit G